MHYDDNSDIIKYCTHKVCECERGPDNITIRTAIGDGAAAERFVVVCTIDFGWDMPLKYNVIQC